MNLVLERSVQMGFYTNLKEIFDSLKGQGEKYNWLLTDIECNYLPDEKLQQDIIWITGSELSKILNR